jgi:HTH-type transcriptional regulator/antitoxin HipB
VFFPERENRECFESDLLYIFPNGKMTRFKIRTPQDLGQQVRKRRTELELTQTELADVSRVTLRFVSELERGKETAQLAGIQRVLASLGLDLYLERR